MKDFIFRRFVVRVRILVPIKQNSHSSNCVKGFTLYDKALHGTRAKYVRSLLKYKGYITAQPVSRTVHCSELLRSLI